MGRQVAALGVLHAFGRNFRHFAFIDIWQNDKKKKKKKKDVTSSSHSIETPRIGRQLVVCNVVVTNLPTDDQSSNNHRVKTGHNRPAGQAAYFLLLLLLPIRNWNRPVKYKEERERERERGGEREKQRNIE